MSSELMYEPQVSTIEIAGQEALDLLRTTYIPTDAQSGNGDLMGTTRAYNPYELPENAGHSIKMRDHLSAQQYNLTELIALGKMREVIVTRRTPQEERGLVLLMLSDGTLINGARSVVTNKGSSVVTAAVKDFGDLENDDWQVLIDAADEVREGQIELKPGHWDRPMQPAGIPQFFFNAYIKYLTSRQK